ncbi:cyclic nucleotide-binding domain-containing protein [Novispirillum itersonii]|uniref:cyclic nucleotide-binding domain-containing protein n=1 Tax=Novispirillum itersonii TaxID=189 RepID=UPI00035E9C08|nr:cyclic nucleotide-binding domain-containing protein [Novispirillum itersonii]
MPLKDQPTASLRPSSALLPPLLRDLPPAVLAAALPLLDRRQIPDGGCILREGDPSEALCLLVRGQAVVCKELDGQAMPVGRLSAGDSFGEIGLLTREPRSSSVYADGPAEVWTLPLAALDRLYATTGTDLLTQSARRHATALGERLTRVNTIAAETMQRHLDEFRMRVAFGTLFSNIILLLFLYVSGLGLLRHLSAAGASTTLISAPLLLAMAAGAAVVARLSGFSAGTFGFTLARWRWVLWDSLVWTAVFCAAVTAAKALLLASDYPRPGLALIQPWVSAEGAGATAVAYALYVLLSPVQEFIARGLLQGSLQKMLAGRMVMVRAVLLSNAVFSICHQHLGTGYAVAVFVPGLFWGWMYARHGSLLGVCLSHILIGLWVTGVLDLSSMVS